MSKRLTAIVDASIKEVDMHINMSKTYSQHAHRRVDVSVTEVEVDEVEHNYDHQCKFCQRRFKTQRNMGIHNKWNFKYGYDATEKYQYHRMHDIIGVFDSKKSRWSKIN